jgi:hypothetical protein
MAKHDTDPVLGQLVHAVNESGNARVPMTVSTHGTVITGVLIAQEAYFTDLAEGSPLLSALQGPCPPPPRLPQRRTGGRSHGCLERKPAGAVGYGEGMCCCAAVTTQTAS